jgi:hypothetical protein
MPQFKSFAPDARVLGKMVLAYADCVDFRSIRPYLSQHGFMGRHNLQTIEPDTWYYLQDWLNVLRDVTEHEDESAAVRDFFNIGRGMVTTLNLHEKIAYYPLFETIHTVTYLYDEMHRGDVGEISAKRISHNVIQVTAVIPYPDDLLFGLLSEVAERYDGQRYLVEFNTADAPRRDEGGEVTVYDIGQR